MFFSVYLKLIKVIVVFMVLLCSLSPFKWQVNIIKVCNPYKSSLSVPLNILLKALNHLSHLYSQGPEEFRVNK